MAREVAMSDTPLFDACGVVGVGYEGLDVFQFIEKLKKDQVSLLVDIRKTPISRKPGLSKTRLSENLKAVGIEYKHASCLGNPKWNRPGFSGDPRELEEARSTYSKLMQNNEAKQWIEWIAEQAMTRTVALMCFEACEERCHRYVTIREVRDRIGKLATA
ncbi:hypothetical protein Tfu_2775 [Thermobifida fusca YX]|uniref:DUF488 domain-containing protein n=3 Tax=Thermobifida fusca TaxID=2021 RepID=A0A9P2T9M6_THEFU|nr:MULTISPECIES: DUF488 domain-containing protein [Thermobifida]AAZ56808.1 hypothetical protein Tfu_2775 [Thermobifida fusca YX]EOR70236.1 hypothetical protein TM51_14260 [Thermobifida fusca TM51]MBO2528879.1 DUF488 domain-containing protein [Thermobifida sp.]PZN61815.1 MAG: DUF488 domain-containing protein [Thermobifida fusca]QOS59258.1 DUF488 domain-containing protein [Thermobifida fusca]